MRAIITRGLYIFYPIFHYDLYCRAAYNAERLIMQSGYYFMILFLQQKIELTQCLSYFFVVHTTYKYIRRCGL